MIVSAISNRNQNFYLRSAASNKAWTQELQQQQRQQTNEKKNRIHLNGECSIAHSIVVQILLHHCQWCQQCQRERIKNSIRFTKKNAKKRRSSHNKINGVIIILQLCVASKTVRSTKLAPHNVHANGLWLWFGIGHLATCRHEHIFLFCFFFYDSNWHVKSLINTHRCQCKLNGKKSME